MKGVILFADDQIFNSNGIENKLFQKFNSEGAFSILPIDNLNILEKTVASISTYRALILDWNFERKIEKDEEDGLVFPDETPLEFLKSNKVYSLVYIYSQTTISQHVKEELQTLYPGKIFFETKKSDNKVEDEYKKIIAGISKFETENKHLNVPYIWSHTINKSSQEIFSELENADPNWIKEIYETAKKDGAEPNTEVIEMFHFLLSESIIQDNELLKAIDTNASEKEIKVDNKEESLAKLYNRIYYTKLKEDAPLMTGDIFKFSDDEFAILITPECDINSKRSSELEFLFFSKEESEKFKKKKKRKKDESIFNNGVQSRHILPSFPFIEKEFHLLAFFNFQNAFKVVSRENFEKKRINYKLNSPYIYQLRQRYLAYIGRVGVPAIPQSLKLYNLK